MVALKQLVLCFLLLANLRLKDVHALQGNVNEVYLVPGMYHGLNNQRICITNAIAMAIKLRWTLVLPKWRFSYKDLNNTFLEPLDFLYDLTALESLAPLGLSIAENLPDTKLHACLMQLQHSSDVAKHPRHEILLSWANAHGVVCLRDLYTLDPDEKGRMADHFLQPKIRRVLRPSSQFQEEMERVSRKIQERLDTLDFIGLHIRIEEDFSLYCQADVFKAEECYVQEDGYFQFLQNVMQLQLGQALYIASGAQIDHLPKLCSYYRCFTKTDFWDPNTSPLLHADNLLVQAYIDFLILQFASCFVGNRFSTFSVELYELFKDSRKNAMFVNNVICPADTRLTSVGCTGGLHVCCS